MSQLKLIAVVACLSLIMVETASAQPGWRPYPRRYYGYGPVYAYPPVVAPPPVYVPPPVVVQPYPPPAYVAPPPVVYGPPAYGYGVVGPRRRMGFGYSSPGFGLYLGR